MSMVESNRPIHSNMPPNDSSEKSSVVPARKKKQLGLEQPELVFYPASDNFPYRLKGEPSILDILHNTDWSKTVVGPAKTWPSILVDSIRLALVSRFAMCIWWGPDLLQMYNAKYGAFLGKRHPKAFGRDMRESWQDIWHDIEPLIYAVVDDGESVFLKEGRYWMTRFGWMEETYFTYQYSPIYDDVHDKPVGVFHVVTDETSKVFSERDMLTLRDLSVGTNAATSYSYWKRAVAKVFRTPSNCIDVPTIDLYEIDRETNQFRRIISEGCHTEQPRIHFPDTINIWEEFQSHHSDTFSADNMKIPSHKLRGSSASLVSSTTSDTAEHPQPGRKPLDSATIIKNRLTKAMNDCFVNNKETHLNLPAETLPMPNITVPDTEKIYLQSNGPSANAVIFPIHGSAQDYNDISLVAVLATNRFRKYDEKYRSYFQLLVSQLSGSLGTTAAIEDSERRADELVELNRSKTTFFSNISHEFRTPLSLILGPVDQVLQDPTLNPKSKEMAKMVQRNANRLLKLVNTLLQYTQLETGRMRAQYKPVNNLPETTREIASAFDTVAVRFGLQYILDCPSWEWSEPSGRSHSLDDTTAFVDVDIWEIIILNLLSNAFKHCIKGSVRLTLRRYLRPSSSSPTAAIYRNPFATPAIASSDTATPESVSSITSSVSSAGYYELTVADTGSGIAEEDISRIFDRFYSVRSTESRSHEGIGIGLSFIKDLVESQKGIITVDSTLGVGSTFTVKLPLGFRHLNPHSVVRSVDDNDSVRSPSNHLPTIKVDTLHKSTVNKMLPNNGKLFVAETGGWNDFDDHPQESLIEPSTPSQLVVEPTPAIDIEDYMNHHSDIFKPTVLVCDDNTDMRSYIRHTLTSNFNVIEASNGQEALDIAVRLAASEASEMSMQGEDVVPRRRIDLVLADVMMPVMDGIELSKNLRANPFTRTLPIIMLTARAASGDSMNGLFAGADDYLFKPFDAQELIGRVTTHSNLYRMRLEYADARNKIAVLEAANDAKSKLIALVSHELRTPLQSIIGTVELLREGAQFEEERTDLDNIHYSSHVLSALISDILDVAKIDAGNFVFEPADFNPRILVQHCCDILTEKANSKGLDLVCHIDQGIIERANQDPARIRQCISNMLSNAVKFTEKGYVAVKTYTRLSFSDGRPPRRLVASELESENSWPDKTSAKGDPNATTELVVEVEDTGIGLAQESMHEIFEPFCQANTSSTRPYEGIGLGLAITKQLVEKAGGEVGLVSELGKGSTFWIIWPISPPLASYRAPGEDSTSDDNITLTDDVDVPKDISILIVTKNQVAALAVAENLISANINGITTTTDVNYAMQLVTEAKKPYDVLIADSFLESQCIPLVRKCKENKTFVLTIVSRGLLRTLSKGLKDLTDEVIARPVHRANLLDKLSKLSTEKRTRKISIADQHKHFIGKLEASLQKHIIARTDEQEIPLSPESMTTPSIGSRGSSSTSANQVKESAFNSREHLTPRRQSSVRAPGVIKGTILVAEDNLINQKLLKKQLLKLNYESDVVGNGFEAIKMLKTGKKYIAFLCDCNMPQCDGFQATALIRSSEERFRNIPILAISANAMAGDREKCLNGHMDDYISKPLTIPQLGSALERLLSNSTY
ncbi:hypothetical protein BC943DRAFT_364222 [Umbelopsis sp. AD052]|nr:hypothetical protein BC943DRAFT_364222 [Umbelopsis sp. AD052]